MLLERMDPFLAEFDHLTHRALGGPTVAGLAMPMDVVRSGDEVICRFDLPGVTPDSINVTVDRNVLEVTAAREQEASESETILLRERAIGQVSRRVTLGEWLDADKVSASYVDGVLTVTVPVAEHAKPRRIEISRGSTSKQISS
jgi:HSP20 family protein